jgi:hypothetical protein
LFELLDSSGGAPGTRDDALALSPWAAEFRYGDLVAGSLEREEALAAATAIMDWAESETTR